MEIQNTILSKKLTLISIVLLSVSACSNTPTPTSVATGQANESRVGGGTIINVPPEEHPVRDAMSQVVGVGVLAALVKAADDDSE